MFFWRLLSSLSRLAVMRTKYVAEMVLEMRKSLIFAIICCERKPHFRRRVVITFPTKNYPGVEGWWEASKRRKATNRQICQFPKLGYTLGSRERVLSSLELLSPKNYFCHASSCPRSRSVKLTFPTLWRLKYVVWAVMSCLFRCQKRVN